MTEITTLPTVQLKSFTGLVNDKRSEGWELLEDTNLQGDPILELLEFLEDGETFVISDIMFDRAIKFGKNRAGQQHAERLLTQQHEIPEEWRKFDLVFPGTKWCHSSEVSQIVPVLIWDVNVWYRDVNLWHLHFSSLDHLWSSRARLVFYK